MLPRSLRPHPFERAKGVGVHWSVCWCGKSEMHSIHHQPMALRVAHPYTAPPRCARCGKRLTLTYYEIDGAKYGPVCYRKRIRRT